ncbi:UNVERIFIED_CONTAM: hypothetical protein HDU68_007888 [Siphonaria sp. JEL0065]|nr:hypothetical protein HDU68_007888 [Siphonaria sp. JEL0065]
MLLPSDLIATLPASVTEVHALTRTLNLKQKKAFAAQVAVNHRANPLLVPLVRSLLHTSLLANTIDVQRDNIEIEDDADWDVVENTASVELVVPQTNACKLLSTRVIGIFMAIALKHEEILAEIVAHPSNAFKTKVRKTLQSLEREREKNSLMRDDPKIGFRKWFDAIRSAPLVSKVKTVRSRNTLWDMFNEAHYMEELKLNFFWTNGKLTSILDSDLRNFVAKSLLDLCLSHPPVSIQLDDERNELQIPQIPTAILKNLKELLELDATSTVALFTVTFVTKKETKPVSPTTVVAPSYYILPQYADLFSPKLRFWNQSNVDYLASLKPLFEKLELTTSSYGFSGVLLDHKHWLILAKASLPVSVLSFLLEEAISITSVCIERHLYAIRHNPQHVDNLVAQLSKGFKYIVEMISTLFGRLFKAAANKTKSDTQAQLEVYLQSILDKVFAVFLTFKNGTRFQYYMARQNLEMEWLLSPLLACATGHEGLCLQLFTIGSRIIGSADKYLQKEFVVMVLKALKPTWEPKAVSTFPKWDIEAPYSGLVSKESNKSVVAWMMETNNLTKLEEFNRLCLKWGSIQAYLSPQNLRDYRHLFSTAVLSSWIKESKSAHAVSSAFEIFFEDKSERSKIAGELLDCVKDMGIEAKDVEAINTALTAHLDIASVKPLLQVGLKQKKFEKRNEAIRLAITAANNSKNVEEVIGVFSVVFPRVKNEMRLNMDEIFNSITNACRAAKYFFVINATADQAIRLVSLIESVELNNYSAVSMSTGVNSFLEEIRLKCLTNFLGNPTHPFFQFALDSKWRLTIHENGASTEIPFALQLKNPVYQRSSVKDDKFEILYRKSIARGLELLLEVQPEKATEERLKELEECTHEASELFGWFMIPEGQEVAIAEEIIRNIKTKFDALEQDAMEMNEKVLFEDSDCGRDLLRDLQRGLGLRWRRVPVLVEYFERSLTVLKRADKAIKKSPECALSWSDSEYQRAYEFVSGSCQYAPTAFQKRFSDVRLASTYAEEEATNIFNKIKRNDFKKREELILDLFRRSPRGSALHLDFVLRFVLIYRPDLLTEDHLATTSSIVGIFNQSDDKKRLAFVLNNQRDVCPIPGGVLLDWQMEKLTARYWKEALDKTLPMEHRVLSASRMLNLASISIHEVATFLTSAALPSRVKEAVLMFLPKIDEPSCTINLLLSPVFLESNLARTAVFSLRNTFKFMPHDKLVPILQGLIPPPAGNNTTAKPTVFKEIVRLLSQYVTIPKIFCIVEDLWNREGLNKDVRITLLQRIIALLSHEDETLAKVAWKIAESVVEEKEDMIIFVEVGLVLTMVTREEDSKSSDTKDDDNGCGFSSHCGSEDDDEDEKGLISCPSFSFSGYNFANLSKAVSMRGSYAVDLIYQIDQVIPIKIADEYATKILVPFIKTLFNYYHTNVRTLTPEIANDLRNRLTYSYSVLVKQKFITPTTAPVVTAVLAPLLSVANVRTTGDSLADFCPLITVLTNCISQESLAPSTAVPAAWVHICESIKTVTKASFDTEIPLKTRNKYFTAKLDWLNLYAKFLWGPEVHPHSIMRTREAMLAPVVAIESISEDLKLHFRDLRWSRIAAVYSANVDFVKVNSKTSEGYQESVATALKLAQELVIEAVRDGYIKIGKGAVQANKWSTFCYKLGTDCEIPNSHLVPGLKDVFIDIFNNKEWGKSGELGIEGLVVDDVVLCELHFALLKLIPQKFCTVARLAEFVWWFWDLELENVEGGTFGIDRLMDRITLEVIVQLKSLKSVRDSWNTWKKTYHQNDSPAEPKFEKEDWTALSLIVEEIGSRCEKANYKKKSPYYKSILSIITSDVVFALEIAPVSIAKFLSQGSHIPAITTWLCHLSILYNKQQQFKQGSLDAFDQDALDRGIVVISPILHSIFSAAKAVSFEKDHKNTDIFRSLLASHLGVFLHIVPDAQCWIHQNPGWEPFVKHIKQNAGCEMLSVYMQHLQAGAGESFDVLKVSSLYDLRHETFAGLIQRLFDFNKWDSSNRLEAFHTFQSVAGVAQRFVEVWGSDIPKATVSVGGDCPISFINSLPRLSWANVPTESHATVGSEVDIEDIVVANIQASFAFISNPYLYLTALVDICNKATIDEAGRFPAYDIDTILAPFKIKVSEVIPPNQTVTSGDTVKNPIPIAFFLDIARILVKEVAAHFDALGENRVANGVKKIAVELLADIQTSTMKNELKKANKNHRDYLYDLLLREGAKTVYGDVEMGEEKEEEELFVVEGWKQLVDELWLGGDRSIHTRVQEMLKCHWQLEWKGPAILQGQAIEWRTIIGDRGNGSGWGIDWEKDGENAEIDWGNDGENAEIDWDKEADEVDVEEEDESQADDDDEMDEE